MARLVAFEDNFQAGIIPALNALDGSEHTLDLDHIATNIPEAHRLITKLALGEIAADYALVDGTLESYGRESTFRFTKPGDELPKAAPKKWYQTQTGYEAAVAARVNPKEIVVAREQLDIGIGSDGRHVLRVLKACNIDIITIGASSDSARSWGGEVDHDLTKRKIEGGLLPLIERLEAEKAGRR